MANIPDVKVCGMCRMEIAANAKKCPYCQHWQNKLSMLMFHPSFATLLIAIPLILSFALLGMTFKRTLSQGEDFQKYSNQIKVSESRLQFGESKRGHTVAVVGRMRNESTVDWKEVHFQVEFRDTDGNLIDAGQEFEYAFYLPTQEEAAFKVSFRREFPTELYASHSIRVIEAKDGKTRF
jgi:hypothetical protein